MTKAGVKKLRGWLSTDEEEIERRRERAQVEPLSVPRSLPLLSRLRGDTEALLGAGEDEVRSWIGEGARWAEALGREMRG